MVFVQRGLRRGVFVHGVQPEENARQPLSIPPKAPGASNMKTPFASVELAKLQLTNVKNWPWPAQSADPSLATTPIPLSARDITHAVFSYSVRHILCVRCGLLRTVLRAVWMPPVRSMLRTPHLLLSAARAIFCGTPGMAAHLSASMPAKRSVRMRAGVPRPHLWRSSRSTEFAARSLDIISAGPVSFVTVSVLHAVFRFVLLHRAGRKTDNAVVRSGKHWRSRTAPTVARRG